MSTPLTDSINALTAYANETTGASDTTLSDAVGRLCEGYGGGDELYPVGTDLVTKYIGRNLSDGLGLFVSGDFSTDTGEMIEGNTEHGISPAYIPINPNYEYYKTAEGRMYTLVFYDENKNYISGMRYAANNTKWTKLPSFPINARYIRFATHSNSSNWGIAIYRIA